MTPDICHLALAVDLIIFIQLRKAILVILSIQILSSGMFLDEVFRVHKLVTHFLEHHEADHSIGLTQFIRLHYFDPRHDRTDPTNHASLPLHNHADAPVSIVFKGQIEQIHVAFSVTAPLRKFRSASVDVSGHSPLGAIFQPPREA